MDASVLITAAQAHPGHIDLAEGHGTYCLLCGHEAVVTDDGGWSCKGGCDPDKATSRLVDWYEHEWKPAQANGQVNATRIQHEVTWDNTRKPPKPVLPPTPTANNPAEQASWTTVVLHLSVSDPIVAAKHQGLTGSGGRVELRRLGGSVIRFEPASKVAKALSFADELVWQLSPADGEPYPWGNQQTIKIARVIRLLCGTSKNLSDRDEVEAIINTFLDASEETVGRTHGTAGERYEAAVLLRPMLDDRGNPIRQRYLIDLDTGEYVIRVSDLTRIARQVIGGSVHHGWLDGRMDALGWERRRLEGWGLSRGPNDRGPHARSDVYRGFLGPIVD